MLLQPTVVHPTRGRFASKACSRLPRVAAHHHPAGMKVEEAAAEPQTSCFLYVRARTPPEYLVWSTPIITGTRVHVLVQLLARCHLLSSEALVQQYPYSYTPTAVAATGATHLCTYDTWHLLRRVRSSPLYLGTRHRMGTRWLKPVLRPPAEIYDYPNQRTQVGDNYKCLFARVIVHNRDSRALLQYLHTRYFSKQ